MIWRAQRGLVWGAAIALAALGLPRLAGAQDTPPASSSGPSSSEQPTLSTYYRAMAERRLLAPETGSAEQLRALVRAGETLYLDDRFEEAQRVLYEVVESPRFADFSSLDDFRQAEYMLAGALQSMGALRSAWRYLERVLERGPDDPYFGPAYRRAVDVALDGANLPESIAALRAIVPPETLPPDAAGELLYLQGRERYDAHDWPGSVRFFEQVGRRSRFYANSRYLQGVVAAQAGRLEDAEAQFCSIASTADHDQYTFFVDRRYFEIRDLTWLALGRVAHEGRRPADAFYYYFQVPQDSARVAEALFEASWSMYEGDDHDTAIDLLDQLAARFPDSPYVHEAALLRGYIHLARCEFEQADQLFRAFQVRFTPLVHEIDRILSSPSRQGRLVEELLRAEAAPPPAATPDDGAEAPETPVHVHALLLSLLRVDPSFHRLYREVRTLDAEAARAGRVPDRLGALIGRLAGADAPRPAEEQLRAADPVTALRADLSGARAVLRALTDQLTAMRDAGAAEAQLEPLEEELSLLGTRLGLLEQGLDRALADRPAPNATAGVGLEQMLRRDQALASRFDARVADVRARMIEAANDAALRALRALRSGVGGYLRRSRIGRIDAVMGSKRRIEIQIESLAAGRFPPELQDPLSVQGLLRDDEEYWPFEGEYWQDEFEEDELDDTDLDDEDRDAVPEETDDGAGEADGGGR